MLTSSSYGDDRKRALEFPMVKTYIVKPLTQHADFLLPPDQWRGQPFKPAGRPRCRLHPYRQTATRSRYGLGKFNTASSPPPSKPPVAASSLVNSPTRRWA